jgi:beta-lactamase regulating signal transducer with metallopeptidase domain
MHRLKRGAHPANTGLEQMMRRLMLTLGVSAPVRLRTCVAVQVPTVIGCIRPLILMPVTTITGLSESQIKAILAHELAHIRRHDYLVNVLQTVIETMLFYHPAVWWVGKQMRVEREHCCDDIAVHLCGSAARHTRGLWLAWKRSAARFRNLGWRRMEANCWSGFAVC